MYYPSQYYLPPCEPLSTAFNEQQRHTQFTTRKVYINQNFVTQPSEKINNVHINPNFKHKVHINPKFKETFTQKANNIYINPLFQQSIINPSNSSILKSNFSQVSNIPSENIVNNLKVIVDTTNTKHITRIAKIYNTPTSLVNNSTNVISTKNKLIRVPCTAKEIPQNYKISTKNKLIRIPYTIDKNKLINTTSIRNKNVTNYKLSTSNTSIRNFSSARPLFNSNSNLDVINSSTKDINSKYKIIRNRKPKTSFNIISQHKIVRKSLPLQKHKQNITKNKYKLDRRIINNGAKKLKHKITKKAYLMNFDPSREIIKRTTKSKLVKNLPRFIKIKDQVYKFNSNYDTLYFVSSNKHKVNKIKPSKIVIHNYTFVLMPTGVYKRQHVNKIKINSRMLKKDNNPCLRYRQRGFCKEYENGTCSKKHDPNQIRMCTKFLQGACLNDACLLSHKVSPEKMPTCKYFLDGFCHKNNCPYLHVKLNKNVEICKQFLEGFCSLGLECNKRHQFLCPTFEAKGCCSKINCKYPHKILEDSLNKNSKRKIVNYKQKDETKKENKVKEFHKSEPKIADLQYDATDLLRYYETKQDLMESVDEKETVPLSERPKIGRLPSFIAIE